MSYDALSVKHKRAVPSTMFSKRQYHKITILVKTGLSLLIARPLLNSRNEIKPAPKYGHASWLPWPNGAGFQNLAPNQTDLYALKQHPNRKC